MTETTPPARPLPQATVLTMAVLAALVALYALVPDLRSAALVLVCATLVSGVFALPAAGVAKVGVCAPVLLAATVLSLWHLDPQEFNLLRDGADALLVCLVMPVISHGAAQAHARYGQLLTEQHTLIQTLGQLEAMATHDPLTGALNQQHMADVALRQAKRAHRAGASLSVALFNLDHFAAINERQGTAGGDEVLRDVGRIAAAALRQSDVLARWAGDEFMVLFVDTAPVDALEGLRRLRQQLPASITFSAGLTSWQEHDTLQTVVLRMDDAMREAKQQGRDRIVQRDSATQDASMAPSP